jgi:hypothetical protein
MHQERNVAESIISMCLDVTGFTKDNMNVRKDLAGLCDHPSLEPGANARGNLTKPRAPYCLVSKDRIDILKWLKTLKLQVPGPTGGSGSTSTRTLFRMRWQRCSG